MQINITQVQQLLVNLGQSVEVDGIWGRQSQSALDAELAKYEKQAISDKVSDNSFDDLVENTLGFWADIRHFTRTEFRCPCPRCGGFPVEPNESLVRIADSVREYFGKPMIISSGVRCQAHNDELSGSVSNSRHVQGKAVDFCISGMPSSIVKVYIDQLVKARKLRYCYCIDNNFLHMDVL